MALQLDWIVRGADGAAPDLGCREASRGPPTHGRSFFFALASPLHVALFSFFNFDIIALLQSPVSLAVGVVVVALNYALF